MHCFDTPRPLLLVQLAKVVIFGLRPSVPIGIRHESSLSMFPLCSVWLYRAPGPPHLLYDVYYYYLLLLSWNSILSYVHNLYRLVWTKVHTEKPSTSENKYVLNNSMDPAVLVYACVLSFVRRFGRMVIFAITAIIAMLLVVCTQMYPIKVLCP